MWKRFSFRSQNASIPQNPAERNSQSRDGDNVAQALTAESAAEDPSTNDNAGINVVSGPAPEEKATNVSVVPEPRSPAVPANDRDISSASPPGRTIYHRISFRSLAFFYGRDKTSIPQGSAVPLTGGDQKCKRMVKLSRSQKEARTVAIHLRTLMLGPSAEVGEVGSPGRQRLKSAKAPPKPSLIKMKSQLSKTKSANLVISQLRMLPLPDGPSFHATRSLSAESLVTHPDMNGSPVHAVCLSCTDEEAHKLYFSKLKTGHDLSPYEHLRPVSHVASKPASMATASLESLLSVLQGLKLVSLIQSPDLGFGQPVSETAGPLAGSVPSASTVMQGFEDITKQLMSLGYATSQALPLPSHIGIYPPEDRLSILTYWWGWEVVMPEVTVQYLGKVKSISGTLLNILSAISMFNQGVREILPFIRYASNFVDYEWNAIKAQDKGKGVVCAATWIMPAALIPRAWDFSPKPSATPSPSPGGSGQPLANGASTKPVQVTPVGLSPALMPQLMVTSPTLPRGFNAQQVIAV